MISIQRSFLITLILVFFISIEGTSAKRYVIPTDNEVRKHINRHKEDLLNPNDIKILVWNMYKGEKETWIQDFLKLSKDKDILLLQEVFLDPKMKSTFLKDQLRGFFMAISFFDTKKLRAATGVATASHARPLRTFWQRSSFREPVVDTPKMVTFAEYELEGTTETLMTANLHAINFVPAYKFKDMVESIINELEKHDGPIVFAGDFNTWSKQKINIMHELTGRIGLEEVHFSDGDERMKTFGNVIDYVFTKGLNVKKSEVYGEIEGSDHKAMEVHLSLKRLPF
jgi:endonuclease/exonuclease/phosphatase (EEP) superfamily protein YafD